MLISALQHKSKYKSNSILNFFEEKKSYFLVSMLKYSWRPSRWRINYLCIGLILTKPGAISFLGVRTKFNFELFWKKNIIFGFPFCSTLEDLSIDVSITNVGLILTKPGHFFSRRTETRGTDKIQFRQFRTFLKKKNQIFGFPCCITREDLSIDVSITNVGLILTKLR